jgi:hypothetical protein
MSDSDRLKLLFASYQPPLLNRGDRATCLYATTDIVMDSKGSQRLFLAAAETGGAAS